MVAVTSLVARLAESLRPSAHKALGTDDGELFLRRVRAYLPDVAAPLDRLYGAETDLETFLLGLLEDVLARAADRRPPLRELDAGRVADPGWFQDQSVIAYVCYTDRFAHDLQGIRRRLDYLAELGVRYLHLMPVLEPREGESDGGYAIADYDAVDPRLGTMADLTELSDDLHRRGMVLCIDLVLNHTAREHAWARRAIAGDARFRDFYLVFPDRRLPDEYEKTTPDIFPELAPGTFSHVPELDGWVWTTFRDFQWDLNYANPAVFRAMLDTMLTLANRGADVLRLDAAPFLWKRLGTDCMDQPETHLLLQAFRGLTRIGAPGLLLKAEAMLAPELLGKYLGDHGTYLPECDLAYDNQLMVMLWSSVATGDASLAVQALNRRAPAPSATAWTTYVRCHDDIGWAVSDVDAERAGLVGSAHRRFLSDFFAGDVAGSFARGARFQQNATGASPISGTAASLCGIEAALESATPQAVDASELELALRRLESLYSVIFSFGGIPLIYMGDELGMLNDKDWERDAAHRGDNRWMHRPVMDWLAADARADDSTVPGRLFAAMRGLATARASQPALRSDVPVRMIAAEDTALLAYCRRPDSGSTLLAVVNLSGTPRRIDRHLLAEAGIDQPRIVRSTAGTQCADDGRIEIPACGFVWLS